MRHVFHLLLPRDWMSDGTTVLAFLLPSSRKSAEGILIQPDGTFRSGYALPGAYDLDIEILGTTDGTMGRIAMAMVPVKIGKIPNGREDHPLDIGTVVLHRYHPAAATQPAH